MRIGEFDVSLAKRDVEYLASRPEAMAGALIEVEQIQRYTLYAVAVIGFFVWLMLMSRR